MIEAESIATADEILPRLYEIDGRIDSEDAGDGRRALDFASATPVAAIEMKLVESVKGRIALPALSGRFFHRILSDGHRVGTARNDALGTVGARGAQARIPAALRDSRIVRNGRIGARNSRIGGRNSRIGSRIGWNGIGR